MNKLKILPSAAGIIALASTMGFVDGKAELEDLSRDKITHVKVLTNTEANVVLGGTSPDGNPDHAVYLVEINRGELTKHVVIDAVNGKILKS